MEIDVLLVFFKFYTLSLVETLKRIKNVSTCITLVVRVDFLEIINVRFPNKIIRELDELSERFNLNRSEIIRQALIIYLNLVQNMGKYIRPAILEVNPNQVSYLRRGDVSILKIPTGHAIVVGSSSSGAIGPKELDQIKVSGKILGKFLARVAPESCRSPPERPGS